MSKTKQTCIDNIFCNFVDLKIRSGVIQEKISDHFPTFLIVDNIFKKNISRTKKTVTTRIITKEKQSEFLKRLETVSWTNVIKEEDVNIAYDKFLDEFLYHYENTFPLVSREVKDKSFHNKWMTPGILKSSRKKQKLYDKYIKSKLASAQKKYKEYVKVFNKLIKKAKIYYYSDKLKKCNNDIKKLGMYERNYL